MIKTRKDLRFFLQEDAKANRMEGCSLLKYWVRLFIGSEAAHVYKYLKVLRHCEYHCNNGGGVLFIRCFSGIIRYAYIV